MSDPVYPGFRSVEWSAVQDGTVVYLPRPATRHPTELEPFLVLDNWTHSVSPAGQIAGQTHRDDRVVYIKNGPVVVVRVRDHSLPPLVYTDIAAEVVTVLPDGECLKSRPLGLDSVSAAVADSIRRCRFDCWPELYGSWDVENRALAEDDKETQSFALSDRLTVMAIVAELLRVGVWCRIDPVSQTTYRITVSRSTFAMIASHCEELLGVRNVSVS